MSNPSVTATISVDDKASPALKELARLAKMIAQETAQALNGGNGNALAQSYNKANAAAREHIGTLTSIRNLHREIAGIAAGVAGSKLYQGARSAVANFLPYEKGVRYQNAIQGFGAADQKLLDAQRVEAAKRFGVLPMDTLNAQQAFVTRNFSAPITKAATDQALILSKALNVPVEESSKIVEGMTFAQGTHLKDPASASYEMRKSSDRAAIAAKAGAMSPEDVRQFSKYGMGMATAAGISADQAYAIGMTLKRSNVGGDESGVFMRQLSARLMAPTQKSFDAFGHMGIRYDDYSTQGNVSPEAIDSAMKRHYGKGLSDQGKVNLTEAFGDESRNVLGNREEFTTAVREAVEAGGEKLSKIDQKHLVDTALRQYDLAKSGFRGGDLLEAILAKGAPKDLQALVGDKQGGRATVLLSALDQYREYLEKLSHGDGYAEKIANERMEGAAAAVDRFNASLDEASKKLVEANQGLVEKVANLASGAIGSLLKLSTERMQELTVAGALGAGAAGLAATAGVMNLANAANVAAASLFRIAAAPGGLPGLPGVPGAPAKGLPGAVSTASKVAGTAAFASRALGWAAVGATVVPPLWDLARDEAAGTDDTKGGGAANYRRRLRQLHSQQNELEDLVSSDSGPFDRFQPNTWNARRGATSDYLRRLNASGEAPGGGWQDSTGIVVKRATEGPGKWGEISVSGNVTGSAELHQTLMIEVRPSAYFESLVKQAQSQSTLYLNGKLGTSMQGPGDNGTKPSASPLTGTQ